MCANRRTVRPTMGAAHNLRVRRRLERRVMIWVMFYSCLRAREVLRALARIVSHPTSVGL